MTRSPGPGGGRRRYVPDWPTNIPERRRRMSRVLLLVAALFAVIIFATPVLFSGDDETSGSDGDLEERGNAWYLADEGDAVLVTVERVIDGDTLDVSLFDGERMRVRLFGIDAPEMGDPCYDDATERLRSLAGSEVGMVADERLEDPGGRALRYLFTPAGLSIDAVLVDEGLAEAWRADGAYRDRLVALQEDARDAGRGCLWAGSG